MYGKLVQTLLVLAQGRFFLSLLSLLTIFLIVIDQYAHGGSGHIGGMGAGQGFFAKFIGIPY